MRYWVYINDKVEGPFEEDKLVTLQGFTPDTLICSEDTANSGSQEWVKASSIFEFDQVASGQPQTADIPQAAPTADSADNLAAVLLAKLDVLTSQISSLQGKLDNMQMKLDDAVKAPQSTGAEAPSMMSLQDDSRANTITLTRHDVLDQPEEPLTSSADETFADTAATDLTTKEGEGEIISSAMDSLSNAKRMQEENDAKENTLQDLLTPKQVTELVQQADAAALAQENQQPSAQEQAKEDLITELTAQPQADVVDQIIKEKEEEKADSLHLAEGAALAAGVAAAAMSATQPQEQSTPQESQDKPSLDLNPEEPASQEAPAEAAPAQHDDLQDINQEPVFSSEPEEVQPAPEPEVQEVPAQETPAPAAEEPAPDAEEPVPDENDGIPSLDAGQQPLQQDGESAAETSMRELVPGAKMENPEGVLITEDDLKEAFTERRPQGEQSIEQMFGLATAEGEVKASLKQEGEGEETSQEQVLPELSQATAETEKQPVSNPNDLTEIELKEGSTYLISDFVPPAQAGAAATPEDAGIGLSSTQGDQKSDESTELEEMVALKTQTENPADALTDSPVDVTVSKVILENTIKTKRGASLDIKTVPMVPEPKDSERLHLEGMDDDLNTQHDVKQADGRPTPKNTKIVVGSLIGVLLACLIYAMLAFMHLIPASLNLFSSGKANTQQAAQMEEMLTPAADETAQYAPETTAEPAAAEPSSQMDIALEEVKNYPLMNGYTLKEFIASKHPAVQEMIAWEISTAVDPDNYSVLVKVPPENPQSFKTSYRFNYNAVTRALDPTISDAKNLLDSANPAVAQ